MSNPIDEVEFVAATRENKPDYDEIDISTSAFWRQTLEEQDRSFHVLRTLRPVSWQRPAEFALLPEPDDPGYWAVTGHAAICEVTRNSDVFISGQGVMYDTLPPAILEAALSFEAMDGPRHARMRALAASAFTPNQVRRMQHTIDWTAERLLDGVVSLGQIDFVADLAVHLPLVSFCDIMGVPEQHRDLVGSAVADTVAWADPEVLRGRSAVQVQMEAVQTLHAIAAEMYADRLRRPGEDLFSALVQAEVEGQRLDAAQLGALFVLVSIAATDTTKHTASFAALGLTEFPKQRAWLTADFDGRIDTAVEEMVRYGTVVMNLRRTAVSETDLAGMHIMPGDKVVMFYSAGNRDESLFANPHALDLSRHPNPHVGFGGGGVHHCFGAHLAKAQLRALFRELLTRIPDFRAGNPRLLGTNFMRGITHLDFEFTPVKG